MHLHIYLDHCTTHNMEEDEETDSQDTKAAMRCTQHQLALQSRDISWNILVHNRPVMGGGGGRGREGRREEERRRICGKTTESTRHRQRQRDREREGERDREREREFKREFKRVQERESSRESSRVQERVQEREFKRESSRERVQERESSREREFKRERVQEREREFKRERDRDRERDRHTYNIAKNACEECKSQNTQITITDTHDFDCRVCKYICVGERGNNKKLCIQYSTVSNTVQYSTVQYSTVQYPIQYPIHCCQYDMQTTQRAKAWE
jgi:hypothetical protein